jgi:DNA helicase HerA-like ATPase
VQRLTAIERMLSEGAKFGLSTIIAHHNMSQIRQELLLVVYGKESHAK